MANRLSCRVSHLWGLYGLVGGRAFCYSLRIHVSDTWHIYHIYQRLIFQSISQRATVSTKMVLTLSSLLLQAGARASHMAFANGGGRCSALALALPQLVSRWTARFAIILPFEHLEHFCLRCDLVNNATNSGVSAQRPAYTVSYSLESRLDHSSRGVAQGLANLLLAATHSGPTATAQ